MTEEWNIFWQVFHWTHEMPPDQKRPLDTYYDNDRGRLASYQLEVSWYQYLPCLSDKEGNWQCCGVKRYGKVSYSKLIVLGPVFQMAHSAIQGIHRYQRIRINETYCAIHRIVIYLGKIVIHPSNIRGLFKQCDGNLPTVFLWYLDQINSRTRPAMLWPIVS